MPLVSSSIPNLINGVSQQPAALRLASQAEQVVNCMPSPVEGLKKRPPSYNVGKLFSGTAGTGRPFTTIVDRDGTIQYLVLILDNDIKVFGLDGSVKTLATPDGTSYLNIAGEPSSAFRVASVADYTFIVNREKTVAMAADLSPTWGTKSMVFVKSVDYSTTYKVKVDSTEASYTTAAVGGTVPTSVTVASELAGLLATSAINPVATTLTSNTSAHTTTLINFNSTTGVVVGQYLTDAAGHIPKGARVTNVTATQVTFSPAASSSVQNNNLITFRTATFVIDAVDYIIRIEKADGGAYSLTATDTRTGEGILSVKGSVSGLSSLPTRADHGFIVEIQGSASTRTDDYYVVFEANAGSGFDEGVWKETVAPGIVYKFDATTMPHVLVRESNGTFTFKKFDWSPRVAGNVDTAPNPTFVGSTIQNVNLFRNRLVFLADENVVLSAADSYDRFWPETVQTVVDSDPIDLTTGGREINFLVSSLAFANVLLLFSRHGQFRLDSGTTSGLALTPKTATITPVTSFEMVDSVDPVGVGRTIYFSVPKGDFTGLREFFLPDASGPVPVSEEVTSSVPRFVPKNLCNLIATTSEETILAISKDQPKRVYLYKFFFQDDTKLQSAWSYWEVKGNKSIIGAGLVDSDLYLVVEYSDGVYLEKVIMRPENVDTGTSIEVLLDRKITETSCTVALTNPAGLDVQSTITLPYPIAASSTMVVVGRYFAGNTVQHGQVIVPLSQTLTGGAGGNGTLVVRGNLTNAKFYVGELYDMLYEFSTQYLKEQPPGGGIAVVGGPRLQLRTWTMIFDQTSHFEIKVTPRGRSTFNYPYNGIHPGDGDLLGSPGIATSKFRVPVMTQNIDAKIQIASASALPCRLQSAEWEGWYHSRAGRM